MILTSGWCKGMKLVAPKGEITRPTSAKTRESIINILQQRISDAFFVDLFAGSGAVGLSAVSRGARGCIFVEKDRSAFTALDKNLKEAQRRADKQNVELTPFKAINKDISAGWHDISRFGAADIIWADPPYAMTVSWLEGAVGTLASNLKSDGVFALESSFDEFAEIKKALENWDLVKDRKFGGTLLTVWQQR